MSEYKHLDDIERREHRDVLVQWLVAAALLAAMVIVVIEMIYGP